VPENLVVSTAAARPNKADGCRLLRPLLGRRQELALVVLQKLVEQRQRSQNILNLVRSLTHRSNVRLERIVGRGVIDLFLFFLGRENIGINIRIER
jgi:hypothetical protein